MKNFVRIHVIVLLLRMMYVLLPSTFRVKDFLTKKKNPHSFFSSSDIRDVRRRRRPYILPPGQSGLHNVLHVRRREETSYAVPVEFGVQPERERMRLAGER